MNFEHALKRNMTDLFNADLEISDFFSFSNNNKIICFGKDLK